MKKSFFLSLALLICLSALGKPTGTYTYVVEGFDWGAGVNKVILHLADTTSKVMASDYHVFASRQTAAGPITDL